MSTRLPRTGIGRVNGGAWRFGIGGIALVGGTGVVRPDDKIGRLQLVCMEGVIDHNDWPSYDSSSNESEIPSKGSALAFLCIFFE